VIDLYLYLGLGNNSNVLKGEPYCPFWVCYINTYWGPSPSHTHHFSLLFFGHIPTKLSWVPLYKYVFIFSVHLNWTHLHMQWISLWSWSCTKQTHILACKKAKWLQSSTNFRWAHRSQLSGSQYLVLVVLVHHHPTYILGKYFLKHLISI